VASRASISARRVRSHDSDRRGSLVVFSIWWGARARYAGRRLWPRGLPHVFPLGRAAGRRGRTGACFLEATQPFFEREVAASKRSTSTRRRARISSNLTGSVVGGVTLGAMNIFILASCAAVGVYFGGGPVAESVAGGRIRIRRPVPAPVPDPATGSCSGEVLSWLVT